MMGTMFSIIDEPRDSSRWLLSSTAVIKGEKVISRLLGGIYLRLPSTTQLEQEYEN